MDWKAAYKVALAKSKVLWEQTSHDLVEKHWPRIQQLFQDKIHPAALSAAQNDAAIRRWALRVYDRLPRSFRVAISEERFVAICLERRDKLVKGQPDFKRPEEGEGAGTAELGSDGVETGAGQEPEVAGEAGSDKAEGPRSGGETGSGESSAKRLDG